VMEYIDGRPIDEHSHTTSVREKVALIATVCDAIASAHQNLVVHRDLKPSNILVDRNGNPRVLDFGIAKILDESNATQTIERRLTPEYASPEQFLGAPSTTASDIYSLGAVLYKLLAGEPPAREKPLPPSRAGAMVDGDLHTIVMKAIRAEPHERYRTADKFAEDLRAWLDHRPVSARQGERWYRARRQLRRHWALATAGTIAASGLVVGLVVARSERDVAQQRFEVARKLANEFLSLEKDIQNLPGSATVRERMVNTSIRYLEDLSKRAGDDWRLKADIAAGYRKAAEAQGVFRGVNLGHPEEARQSLKQAEALLTEVSAAPGDRQVLWQAPWRLMAACCGRPAI
jgi:serine/threonine protein kinase